MLSINPAINSNLNCTPKRNNPSFGMALKIDPSAAPIIKRQALALGNEGNSFFAEIQGVINTQKNNPVDIILRKAKYRNALAASIKDAEAAKKFGEAKISTSQPWIFKTGNLNFLHKAEKEADKLNQTNNKVKDLMENVGIKKELIRL